MIGMPASKPLRINHRAIPSLSQAPAPSNTAGAITLGAANRRKPSWEACRPVRHLRNTGRSKIRLPRREANSTRAPPHSKSAAANTSKRYRGSEANPIAASRTTDITSVSLSITTTGADRATGTEARSRSR